MKSIITINKVILTVIAILCSTYIALILAISRFFKLDTRKEILNLMYNFKVDAPQYNRKGNYIQGKIHSNIIKIQSYTYQKIKNINKNTPKYKLRILMVLVKKI